MKNLKSKLILVISLTILLQVLTACVSSPAEPEIKIVVPELCFPTFPAPKNGIVLPLDEKFKEVKDNETEIAYVIMPLWYWNLIIDYKCDMDVAVAAYKSARNKSKE